MQGVFEYLNLQYQQMASWLQRGKPNRNLTTLTAKTSPPRSQLPCEKPHLALERMSGSMFKVLTKSTKST